MENINGHYFPFLQPCQVETIPMQFSSEIEIKRDADSHFILEYPNQKYMKAELLGKGGFASCYKLIKVCPQKSVFAGKVISKDSLKPFNRKQKLECEITLQKSLNHKHIVKLEHFFEDDTNVYILLEFCEHQSLHDLLKRRGYLTEVEARYFMKQLISAVEYMHSKGVMHRDLKTGNVFIADNTQLKVGDLGLAVQIKEGEGRRSFCGTPNYMAPEVVNKQQKYGNRDDYGLEIDIWALGLFLYNFIEGHSPFNSNDLNRNYENILKANYPISTNQQRHLQGRPPISNEARDLVQKILQPNIEVRLNLAQIKQHAFFTNPSDGLPAYVIPEALPNSILDSPLSQEFIAGLRKKVQEQSLIRSQCEKYIRVNQWIAVERYGIGYKLSDQTVGEILPDKSLMFFMEGHICHRGKDQEIEIYQQAPDHLHKKHKMLRWFKKELEVPNKILYFQNYSDNPQHCFVERYLNLKQRAVMFWLSNGTLQINFPKFCALVRQKNVTTLMGMLGLGQKENCQVISIFNEQNPIQPTEIEYYPSMSLENLSLEAVTTIQMLLEAQTIQARRQKIQEKSPKKPNQSPTGLKDTRNVLQEKAQNLILRRAESNL